MVVLFVFNYSLNKCPQTWAHGAGHCCYGACLPAVRGCYADPMGVPGTTVHLQKKKEAECRRTPL